MCPYNATHRLFKNEVTEHVVTCPTRNVLESEMHSGVSNSVFSHNKIKYFFTLNSLNMSLYIIL